MEYENLEKAQKLCKEIKEKQDFVNGLNGEFVNVRVYDNTYFLTEIPKNESVPHQYQKQVIQFINSLIEKAESDIRQLKLELSRL